MVQIILQMEQTKKTPGSYAIRGLLTVSNDNRKGWATTARDGRQPQGMGDNRKGLSLLIQKVLQLEAVARLAELLKRTRLDLVRTFAGEPQLLSYLGQCAASSIQQAEAQLDQVALPIIERP